LKWYPSYKGKTNRHSRRSIGLLISQPTLRWNLFIYCHVRPLYLSMISFLSSGVRAQTGPCLWTLTSISVRCAETFLAKRVSPQMPEASIVFMQPPLCAVMPQRHLLPSAARGTSIASIPSAALESTFHVGLSFVVVPSNSTTTWFRDALTHISQLARIEYYSSSPQHQNFTSFIFPVSTLIQGVYSVVFLRSFWLVPHRMTGPTHSTSFIY
jgi:hypothetical protein